MIDKQTTAFTTADLVRALENLSGVNDSSTPAKLRYVIYARKSTDDPIRQSRSLGDQVTEAKEFAERLGLRVSGVITESESACEPDIRPKFRQMIEELQGGRYDGLITWKPDRLARNMKEGGEIIDLLDKDVIKDLKFVSFSFENDTSGKMLLGMAFVLSKQYSDQLSDNVKRGNQRSVGEGKYINTAKHGYYKDPNQYLRPDGDNFAILKEGFVMRINGTRLDEIVEHINQRGYQRPRKTRSGRLQHVPYRMNKSRLSQILRDPIYAGVMRYGKQVEDLTELYDFVQMITVEQYLKLNKFSDIGSAIRSVYKNKRDGVKADLLRGVVVCGDCNEAMHTGITPKKKKDGTVTKYFYYRCETAGCPFQNKSVRAKVVLEFAYDFLGRVSLNNKKTYNKYKSLMQKSIRDRLKEAERMMRSMRTKVSTLKKKIDENKELATEYKGDVELAKVFLVDVKRYDKERKEIEKTLHQLENATDEQKAGILTYEEFLELFGNIAKITANSKSMHLTDTILKSMFLNFVVQNKQVVDFTLKSPFGDLVEVANSDSVSEGRGGETRTHDLSLPKRAP